MTAKLILFASFGSLILLIASFWLIPDAKTNFSEEEMAIIYSLSGLPDAEEPQTAASAARIELGEALFFDTRLSRDNSQSCASCHIPSKNWTDGLPRAVGLDSLPRHTMSLWNIAYNRWFFWDGRADSPWSQALKPIEAPAEMGGNRLRAYHLIKTNDDLRALYSAAFGESPVYAGDAHFPADGCPCEFDAGLARNWESLDEAEQSFVNRVFVNLGKAIEAFEGQIVSNASRFDTFVDALRADDREAVSVLSASEIRGLKLFIGKARCTLCHNGPNFTDNEFHDIRLKQRPDRVDDGRSEGIARLTADVFNANSIFADPKRENVTKFVKAHPRNVGEFKTPSLRNVTLTAPYMHDGRFATLREVIEYYNTLSEAAPLKPHSENLLTPLNLSEREMRDLINFLRSLEDDTIDFMRDRRIARAEE